jgi:tetratricopeptide (TPR) repeat protein
MVHLLLFSLQRGWVTWTPLGLIGVIGWFFGRGRSQRIVTLALIGFALQLYMSSVVTDWHGAWGYAARRLTHATPLIAWGIAALLVALSGGHGRRLVWATAVLSLFAVWNALFLFQVYHHLIPYHRALTWHEFFSDKFHLAVSQERRRDVLEVMEQASLGRAAREQGDEDSAMMHYRHGEMFLSFARSADPRHEDVYLAAAALALERGDRLRAFQEYEACLRDIGADRPQILTSMGVCALYAGDAELAAGLAREALAERPGYARAANLVEDARDGRRDAEHPYFFY